MIKKNIIVFLTVLLIVFSLIVKPTLSKASGIDFPFKTGVNKYAWYASLQSISFMPLLSADSFSGVIITDWYSENNSEQYKVDIYILEKNLTPDTVSVKVFKQKKVGSIWMSETRNTTLEKNLENTILTLARKLYRKEIIQK